MKRYLYLVLIIAFSVLFINNCEEKKTSKYNYQVEYLNSSGDFDFKEEYLRDIADKSHQLIEYIKEKNMDSIVEMCFDGNLMYDSINELYISKKKLPNNFNNYGEVYAYLFDSDLYYKVNKNTIDHYSTDNGKEDFKLCIRDVLLKYNSIYIRKIQIFKPDKSVTVYLDWVNKTTSHSSKIGYSIDFVYVNNKWKIRTLLDRNTF